MRIPLRVHILSLLFKAAPGILERRDGSLVRTGTLVHLMSDTCPANEAFIEGVASKDVLYDLTNHLSLRLYLPEALAAPPQQPPAPPPAAPAPASPAPPAAPPLLAAPTPPPGARAAAPAAAPRKAPVVLYFHGGGFVFMRNCERMFDAFCRLVARELGVIVASVDYRLAPEHPFPAAYDDAFAALQWLQAQAGPEREPELWLAAHADFRGGCFLMGDSAGANIAHHVACRAASSILPLASTAAIDSSPSSSPSPSPSPSLSCPSSCAHQKGAPPSQPERASWTRTGSLEIGGQILISPFFDGSDELPSERRFAASGCIVTRKMARWMWGKFLPPGAGPDHPAANPLAQGHPPLARMPPSLVLAAELDYLADRAAAYAGALKEAGVGVECVRYEGQVHGFPLLGLGLREFLRDAGSFLTRQRKLSAEAQGGGGWEAAPLLSP